MCNARHAKHTNRAANFCIVLPGASSVISRFMTRFPPIFDCNYFVRRTMITPLRASTILPTAYGMV